jgi:ribonuclease BN (tRNA processing enzyme)
MKLTIIGSAGTFPGPASGCSSYLLEEDGFRMLLDVGNGSTGALQEACGLLGPDAVVVSHLHGDHYLDLVTYTYARRYHPEGSAPLLPVYGPSKIHDAMLRAYGKGIDSLLDEVYEFHPVDRDSIVDIGPFHVDLRRVNHPVETYGMRISADGRSIAYSADSGECSTLVDLAKDADLFLCEASYLDGEDNPPDVHLTGKLAAEYASKASAQKLLLTHLVPWGDQSRTLAEATANYDGDILVARSLDTHTI